jgi:catechol 2,3-dioxygenase-like lactoylglutathione lyase family enzyme
MQPIKGLGWAGTRTDRFAETTAFFRDVLGLPVAHASAHQVVFSLPGDALLEVFGPGDPDHDHFSTGPVVGFFVDDIEAARDQLERAGVELLGPLGGTRETGRWAHFRAPDGNVYELTARPAPGQAPPATGDSTRRANL